MIALPALAVAFAAFCVWLTVRIVNRRELWAKRMLAAVLSLPVLYVASFGPACWLCRSCDIGKLVMAAYSPAFTLYHNGPEPIRTAIIWYSDPMRSVGPLDAIAMIEVRATGMSYDVRPSFKIPPR